MRGKAVRYTHHRTAGWDHPRLCGEKDRANAISGGTEGSPPPMRGKAAPYTYHGIAERITPAYAGKSYLAAVLQGFQQDHPRLCGEKKLTFENYKEIEGSPPPMRGKGKRKMKFEKYMRITPAYAGKRHQYYMHEDYDRDHPRLCGEKCQNRWT